MADGRVMRTRYFVRYNGGCGITRRCRLDIVSFAAGTALRQHGDRMLQFQAYASCSANPKQGEAGRGSRLVTFVWSVVQSR